VFAQIALKYLGGTTPDSAFYAQNLSLALDTVEEWDKYSETPKNKEDMDTFYLDEVQRR
jgi:hypothetical protein